MHKLVLIVAMLFVLFCARSQPAKQFTLQGAVVDQDKKPVTAATVLLKPQTGDSILNTVLTDSLGLFAFRVPAAAYLLEISFSGAATSTIALNLKEDLRMEPIQLRMGGRPLDEVVVSARREAIDQQLGKTVITPGASITSAGGTVWELLEKAPGVTADRSNGRIAINGKEGVSLLIDGKQTYLNPEEAAQFLQNLPSASIQSIEILPNPGSRYDAAGNAGIISIRLRKDSREGYTLRLSSAIGYGRREKLLHSLNFNFRKNRLAAHVTTDLSHNNTVTPTRFLRTIPDNTRPSSLLQINNFRQRILSVPVIAGLEYRINRRQVAELMASYTGGAQSWKENNTAAFSHAGTTDSVYRFFNQSQYKSRRLLLTAAYQLRLDSAGTALMLMTDHLGHKNADEFIYQGVFEYAGNPDRGLLFLADYRLNVMANGFKADLNKTIGRKLQMETGYKFAEVGVRSDPSFIERDSFGTNRPAARNVFFRYQEAVHAGYISTRLDGGKAGTVEAGLRGEWTKTETTEAHHAPVERDYFKLFPFFSFTRKAGKGHQLKATFTSRIDRPTYTSLNPNVRLRTPLLLSQGNPYLRPQYSYTADLTFMTGKLYFNAGYSFVQDKIQIGQTVEAGTKAAIVMLINTNRFASWFGNFNLPMRLAKGWTAQANGGLNYSKTSFLLNGSRFQNKVLNYKLAATQTLQGKKGWSAELFFQFEGPSIDGVFRYRSRWQLNAGIQKTMGDFSVRANITDIFNTNYFRYSANAGDFITDNITRIETRIVRLSFSYRLGKLKWTQAKKTGVDEYINRL
ncbi:MAG TPA: outer membrane beta-barrel protein [Flavisolibacter sp.]|nr:outer membrane beta-barrel protein [Flavisolibacter sp.]